MNPATSIIGTTHQFSIAPPVKIKSVKFIATSIETIEISDIPSAVFRASFRPICLKRIIVSNRIDVTRPLKIASAIIKKTGQTISIS